MSKANLGWLFYKDMYKDGNSDNKIKSTINRLLNVSAKDESLNAKQNFRMTTSYPGLLIGSGYAHGLSNDYDAKIGFYFDHTTGLPLIQGSSVKGMLRSCFGLAIKGKRDKYEKEKHEYIKSILQKDIDVKALATEIFEGLDSKGKSIGIYKRDIFYEARVVDVKDKLLQDDYITPHDNPLKNPKPIRFVKVAPEVTFEFSFDLKDSEDLDVTAYEKEKLFTKLLEEFGIGAKSNVGYGQLELFLSEEEKQAIQQKEQEEAQRLKEELEQKEREQKELAEKERLKLEEEKRAKKAQKAQEGLNALFDCKTLDEAFKLLKDSFGKKPKLTPEQKAIVEKFYKKQKKLSKADEKVFKKYI